MDGRNRSSKKKIIENVFEGAIYGSQKAKKIFIVTIQTFKDTTFPFFVPSGWLFNAHVSYMLV